MSAGAGCLHECHREWLDMDRAMELLGRITGVLPGETLMFERSENGRYENLRIEETP